MLQPPFYDPAKSYWDNLAEGPFNAFADGEVFPEEEPRFDFLGQKVAYPFGIPAGPLLDSKFVKAAFDKGFDIPVYKTVRAGEFPCHPFPNVLAVHPDGDLTLEKAKEPLVADTAYAEPLSITNSFGVPSRTPEMWQPDAKRAVALARKGQVMVLSFMGTVKEGQTEDEFVEDFARAGELAAQTGAKILEANLSCPNIGDEGLVCYNLDMTERVCDAIRDRIGHTPLILKVGYYQNDADLERLGGVAQEYGHAIAAINTVSAPIVNAKGEQALPGSPKRARSGVCGASIKWAGLEMTRRLFTIRQKQGADWKIVGVGGVMVPQDYKDYRDAGADVVMSATGAMWNPYLAKEIKEAFPDG
jgi:dihydroorotate dehydrogenase (NAD+) catalytic subunit